MGRPGGSTHSILDRTRPRVVELVVRVLRRDFGELLNRLDFLFDVRFSCRDDGVHYTKSGGDPVMA